MNKYVEQLESAIESAKSLGENSIVLNRMMPSDGAERTLFFMAIGSVEHRNPHIRYVEKRGLSPISCGEPYIGTLTWSL